MATSPLPDLVFYTRADCRLCDDAREVLRLLLDERARTGLPIPNVLERDIDTDPAGQRAYSDRIPVIELAGHRLELAIGVAKLRRLLREALDAPDDARDRGPDERRATGASSAPSGAPR